MQPQLFDERPTDLAIGGFEERLIIGLFLLFAVAGTIYVLRGRSGWDLRFRLLVLAGSAVCIFLEAGLAHVGGFWYATVGQDFHLPEMWGVSVGLHMLFGYYVFLGVTTLVVVDYIRRGATASGLWKIYGGIFILGCLLELPVLYLTDIYTYYGAQMPFFQEDYWPLPIWYPAVNASLPLAIAGAVMLVASLRERAYLYALPLIMPMSLFASWSAEGWPVITALNSDVTEVVTWGAAAVTIGLALLTTKLLTIALPRLGGSFVLPEPKPEVAGQPVPPPGTRPRSAN